MSGKKKSGKKHIGLPRGATYADKLARDRMIKAAVQASANDARVKLEADIRCQRQLWLCCIAMNEAFGIGPERFKRFAEVLTDLSDEYDKMTSEGGPEYANEKMRQRAEQITGMKIEYLYEHEMAEARQRNEAKGVTFDDPGGAAIADALIEGGEDMNMFIGGLLIGILLGAMAAYYRHQGKLDRALRRGVIRIDGRSFALTEIWR